VFVVSESSSPRPPLYLPNPTPSGEDRFARFVREAAGLDDAGVFADAGDDLGNVEVSVEDAVALGGGSRLILRYNQGYTRTVKTAISLPDEVFEAAEELAGTLGVSRSQLYAQAVAEYVAQRRDETITAKLNEVYSKEPAVIDPVLQEMQSRSIDPGEW
jgi:antitoxin MazE6